MSVRRQSTGALLDREATAVIADTLERVRALCERQEGWNGYDVAAPNPAAIAAALRWVESVHSELAAAGLKWLPPHVSSDEDGNVALEWRGDVKSLTVYIMPDGTEAIKAWGADMNDEMADAKVDTPAERHAAWRWYADE